MVEEARHTKSLLDRMRPEIARRRIESFGRRFGQSHLYFAQHAAFPLALTPDLLYRLWANFNRDIHGVRLNIPWVAVADFLLSSLCDEVGYELYEMRMPVRAALLSDLEANPNYGAQRIKELSSFLLAYVEQTLYSRDPDLRNIANVQRWTALAYMHPRYTAHELAAALSTSIQQNEIAEQLRVASLIEIFAKPLADFDSLLTYARGFRHLTQGDVESAIKYFGEVSKLGDPAPSADTVPEELIETQEEKPQIELTEAVETDIDDFTEEIRHEDTLYIMRSLRIGKSCALIGIDGIGKTSLMRHLNSQRIRERYLSNKINDYIFITIDPLDLTALAHYRSMISKIESVLRGLNISLSTKASSSLTGTERIRQLLLDSVNALVSLYEDKHLIFCFDEFDEVCKETEIHFFRTLRTLCNHFGEHVCYVVASNNVPALIIEEPSRKVIRDIFLELFGGNTRGIKPLTESDTHALINRNLEHQKVIGSSNLLNLLIKLTGSHPGLLMAVISAIAEKDVVIHEGNTIEQIIKVLLSNRSIINECELIWNSLSVLEQQVLKTMQKGILSLNIATPKLHIPPSIFDEIIRVLVLKGVLIEKEQRSYYQCFSSLFTSYLVKSPKK